MVGIVCGFEVQNQFWALSVDLRFRISGGHCLWILGTYSSHLEIISICINLLILFNIVVFNLLENIDINIFRWIKINRYIYIEVEEKKDLTFC